MADPRSRAKTKGPTYPLVEVRQLATLINARFLTATATSCARDELGLDREGVFRVVAALSASDFYKTMPSEQWVGLFQDVYRPTIITPKYQSGVTVYCKVQIVTSENKQLVVISFKRK